MLLFKKSKKLKIYKKHCFISTEKYITKIFSKTLIDFEIMRLDKRIIRLRYILLRNITCYLILIIIILLNMIQLSASRKRNIPIML
jgi:hypothetical protein